MWERNIQNWKLINLLTDHKDHVGHYNTYNFFFLFSDIIEQWPICPLELSAEGKIKLCG